MPLSVTSQTIMDNRRNLVMAFTGVAGNDGDQETLVPKVIVANLSPPNPTIHLKVVSIEYSVNGGLLELLWDAAPPVVFLALQLADHKSFKRFGGMTNSGGITATGNILFSTQKFVPGSSYNIVLEMTKNAPV